MVEEITKIAVEIAKKKGATFLLDKSGPTLVGVSNVLYFDPSLDITDEVMAEINKDRPAVTPTPVTRRHDRGARRPATRRRSRSPASRRPSSDRARKALDFRPNPACVEQAGFFVYGPCRSRSPRLKSPPSPGPRRTAGATTESIRGIASLEAAEPGRHLVPRQPEVQVGRRLDPRLGRPASAGLCRGAGAEPGAHDRGQPLGRARAPVLADRAGPLAQARARDPPVRGGRPGRLGRRLGDRRAAVRRRGGRGRGRARPPAGAACSWGGAPRWARTRWLMPGVVVAAECALGRRVRLHAGRRRRLGRVRLRVRLGPAREGPPGRHGADRRRRRDRGELDDRPRALRPDDRSARAPRSTTSSRWATTS